MIHKTVSDLYVRITVQLLNQIPSFISSDFKEKRDLIGRFSKFEIELKRGVDVSYPEIKKTGRTQPQHNDGRATISSGNNIKANMKRKNNKRYKK